jgi:hypothetical protein
MARFYKPLLNRNVLLALGVLPPTLFLFNGHLWLGLVFMACVVAGRFSVPSLGSEHPHTHPTAR